MDHDFDDSRVDARPDRASTKRERVWCSRPRQPWARRSDSPSGSPTTTVPPRRADLADRAALTLHRARTRGSDATAADHQREVADFWRRSEVVWDGASAAQQALHFNLFTMMQASMRSEGHGVPAKGLTGSGYEGHYFWDTEAYLLPFLIHTSPEVARSLLMHRVRMLPEARRRAREVGCAGRCSPGARSTARRHRPITQPARRSTTSTRTSHTPSTPTSRSPATRTCSFEPRRRAARRDGTNVGGSGVLLRAQGRPVRDPQGDRALTSTPPSSTTTCSPISWPPRT